MVASMSRQADCYDNAAMEAFWSTLKSELIHDRSFASRSEAVHALFEYLEIYYNRNGSTAPWVTKRRWSTKV